MRSNKMQLKLHRTISPPEKTVQKATLCALLRKSGSIRHRPCSLPTTAACAGLTSERSVSNMRGNMGEIKPQLYMLEPQSDSRFGLEFCSKICQKQTYQN